MPRWLSEGISVYEEQQRDPIWGQRMTPQYRQMILTGEMTPVGKLSTAFMSPPSPMHLQFAYYQSSLVVEFLVERFGFEVIKAILADLGQRRGNQRRAQARRARGEGVPPLSSPSHEKKEQGQDALARSRRSSTPSPANEPRPSPPAWTGNSLRVSNSIWRTPTRRLDGSPSIPTTSGPWASTPAP